MVFYFTSNTVNPAAYIYVGKDKVESVFRAHDILQVLTLLETKT